MILILIVLNKLTQPFKLILSFKFCRFDKFQLRFFPIFLLGQVICFKTVALKTGTGSPRSPGAFLRRSKNKAAWIFADYSSYNSKLWPALCGGLVKNTKFNWLYWGLCWRCSGLAKSPGCSPLGENRRSPKFECCTSHNCHQIKMKLLPKQFISCWLASWFRHTSLCLRRLVGFSW